MAVTVEDVKKVARLARIKIEDERVAEIQDSLNGILGFVEQLKEVDCSTVDDSLDDSLALAERPDIVEVCDSAVMNNTEHKACNMFTVPRVIG